jgi:hypothetical protein
LLIDRQSSLFVIEQGSEWAKRLLLVGKVNSLTQCLADRCQSISSLTPPESRLFKITVRLMESFKANEAGHIPTTVLLIYRKATLSLPRLDRFNMVEEGTWLWLFLGVD